MGLQKWKNRVVTGASKVASLISRPFRFCLGVGKEELDSLTGSNFSSLPGKKEDNSSGSSHGSSGSLRSQPPSISHLSQQNLSNEQAMCDLQLGFDQNKECPADGSEPCMKTLENNPTQFGQMNLDTTATATEVPSEVDAARAKAIPAVAAPKIPYDLAANGQMIIHQASLSADLPVIGEGAHGRVLLGNLDEQAVALKVPLLGNEAGDRNTGTRRYQGDGHCWAAAAKGVRSLRREFESLQNFRHPNIVRVLGTVVVSEAVPALAGIILPFFPQGSLRTLMLTRGEKLPVEMVTDLALGFFKGLAEMHKHGYCHFDVKVDNILVGEEGGKLVAVIADLGSARRAEPLGNYGLTVPKGTPGYSAPEILRKPEQAGPAADMYSAGVTLMALLTGNDRLVDWDTARIFDTPKKAARELRKEFAKLQDLDKDLRWIILKCLRVDATKRPTSEAVVKLLEAAQHNKACSTLGGEVGQGKSRKARSSWWDFRSRRQVCPRGRA